MNRSIAAKVLYRKQQMCKNYSPWQIIDSSNCHSPLIQHLFWDPSSTYGLVWSNSSFLFLRDRTLRLIRCRRFLEWVYIVHFWLILLFSAYFRCEWVGIFHSCILSFIVFCYFLSHESWTKKRGTYFCLDLHRAYSSFQNRRLFRSTNF